MTQRKIDLIGIGSPVVDLVAEIDDQTLGQIPGEKGGMELIDADQLRKLKGLIEGVPVRSPGGSAGNTTFGLAQMGLSCAFLGKLGKDDDGSFYQDEFSLRGGDRSRFKIDAEQPTACCISFVTPDAERTMRTHLGAAIGLSPEEISESDFAGCRHAHVEGYLLFNRDLLTGILKTAKAAGVQISLDLGSFEVVKTALDVLPEILEQYVDIVFANEEEAEAFCDSPEPEVGLEAFGRLCSTVAVKIGKDGAWLKQADEKVHVPAMEVANVIDTTGAGDYWAAGFLYGRLKGFDLAICGRMGALMGGQVVQHLGAALPHHTWCNITDQMQQLAAKPAAESPSN